jgi:hypothetical protein
LGIERTWTTETLAFIERHWTSKQVFSLQDFYMVAEGYFVELYPHNNFVREKLRQTLRILRDRHQVRFLGQGIYRLTSRRSRKVPDVIARMPWVWFVFKQYKPSKRAGRAQH